MTRSRSDRTVAALYVQAGGAYAGLDGVELWPAERDARRYAGPWPVVAHPPCARWGRYATWRGAKAGADGGCFVAALEAVRAYGGVLEHPAGSKAWGAFGLAHPSRAGGWKAAGDGGWTCCVDQGHYGHSAPKATWLYVRAAALPVLRWGASFAPGRVENLSALQREATPPVFRDLLLFIARELVA